MNAARTEHEAFRDRGVPGGAYFSVYALRAVEYFPISGIPVAVYLGIGKCTERDQAGRNRTIKDQGLL